MTKEEELPEALRQQIEEKKEGDFRFTYSDNDIYTLPEVMEYRRPEDTASPWKTVI